MSEQYTAESANSDSYKTQSLEELLAEIRTVKRKEQPNKTLPSQVSVNKSSVAAKEMISAKDSLSLNDPTKTMSLGELLAEIRTIKRQSLREVELATGKDVSNAYLSQLEKGHIKKPSPNILHSLASAYAVPYELLMEKAGYITNSKETENTNTSQRSSVFAHLPMSADEETEMIKYLSFLRSKK